MNETYKIKGSIVEIEETKQISATFQKREFAIEVANDKNPAWNEFVKFELIKDKCDIINGMQVGMQVEVSFNVGGRQWTNPQNEVKYFNSLKAWRVTNLSQQGAPPQAYQQPAPVQQALPQGGLDEDVPFMRKHDMEGG